VANRTGITGDRELVAALRSLTEGVSVIDVDKSATAAMKPMTEQTKAGYRPRRQDKNNPYYPEWGRLTPAGKHLDQNIVVRKNKGSRTKRQYWMGPTKKAAKIAHLVEFGTAPHWQPNRRMFHPGARPYPSMTPAYEAHKDEVILRFGRQLWEHLRARAVQLNRKAPRRSSTPRR
jgi:HK97 gp10 family phage protein